MANELSEFQHVTDVYAEECAEMLLILKNLFFEYEFRVEIPKGKAPFASLLMAAPDSDVSEMQAFLYGWRTGREKE